MSDIKYAKLHTFNGRRAMLYGWKPTLTQKFIMLRSDGIHTEWQFTDRYGGVSFSATMMDDCKCCRLKMIGYSHPEYWDTILVPVTAEEEKVMFEEACRMAGLNSVGFENLIHAYGNQLPAEGRVYFGLNAIPYDLAGVIFSFISKRKIWKPHKIKVWCDEACAMVMMKPDKYKDLLTFPKQTLKPHDLTPSDLDMICRYKLERLK